MPPVIATVRREPAHAFGRFATTRNISNGVASRSPSWDRLATTSRAQLERSRSLSRSGELGAEAFVAFPPKNDTAASTLIVDSVSPSRVDSILSPLLGMNANFFEE